MAHPKVKMKFPCLSLSARASASLGGAIALLLTSCAAPPPPPPPPPVEEKKSFQLYHWEGDGVPGAARIVIYLDQQKAHFFRGGREVGWTFVATGRPSHPTPTGSFVITEKTVDKQSNLYGKLLNAEGRVVDSDFNILKEAVPEGHTFSPAPMPLFMRLTDDGVGMHVGKIPRPGRTASHGCIRLPRYMAEKFFANTRLSTPVVVKAKAPVAAPPLEEKTPPPETPPKRGWGILGAADTRQR